MMIDKKSLNKPDKNNHADEEFMFNDLLQSVETPVFILSGINRKIIYSNKKAIDFYGYSSEEFWAMDLQSLSAMPTAFTKRLLDQAFGKSEHHFISLHRHRNKKLSYVEIITCSFDYKDRKYLFAFIFDISTSYMARQKMKKNYEEINCILQAIPETVFLYDKIGNIKYFKLGDNPLSMFRDFNPTGFNIKDTGMPAETIKDTLSVINFALETGEPVHMGHIFHSPKGFKLYSNTKVVPLNDQEALFIVHDITEEVEKEKSEKRYKMLFENLFDPVLIRDVETGSVIDVNESMCRMLGYTRNEFLRLRREDYLLYPDRTVNITNTRELSNIGKVYLKTRVGEVVTSDVRAFPSEIDGRKVAFAIFNNMSIAFPKQPEKDDENEVAI